MNLINVGIVFSILFSIQGKPIYDDRAFKSADSSFNKNQQSIVVGAGEKIGSYQGKGKSNILMTEGGDATLIDLRDSATASVRGGEIAHFFLYDTSSLKMGNDDRDNSLKESGSISFLHLHDSAAASIKGGEISHIIVHDAGSLSVSGNSEISHLTLHDASSVSLSDSSQIYNLTLEDDTRSEISNAQLGFLNIGDRSEAHVHSLDIEGDSFSAPGVKVSGGAVVLESGTALHIYGREVNFADGKLSGIWDDGTGYEFWLIRRVKNNWFERFWHGEDSDREYFEIPQSMPKEIIFHQTN